MTSQVGTTPTAQPRCMIETPLGVTRANEIASAHETVSCLVLGTSDLTRDLQANHTPDRTPLLYRYSSRVYKETKRFGSLSPVKLLCLVYRANDEGGAVPWQT